MCHRIIEIVGIHGRGEKLSEHSFSLHRCKYLLRCLKPLLSSVLFIEDAVVRIL